MNFVYRSLGADIEASITIPYWSSVLTYETVRVLVEGDRSEIKTFVSLNHFDGVNWDVPPIGEDFVSYSFVPPLPQWRNILVEPDRLYLVYGQVAVATYQPVFQRGLFIARPDEFNWECYLPGCKFASVQPAGMCGPRFVKLPGYNVSHWMGLPKGLSLYGAS